jgi:hypothetical protein
MIFFTESANSRNLSRRSSDSVGEPRVPNPAFLSKKSWSGPTAQDIEELLVTLPESVRAGRSTSDRQELALAVARATYSGVGG